jgi:uncharacterized damage-inducible protein DinB
MPQQPESARRIDPPLEADERTMLDAWLDYQRETLLWKCEGLSDDQLKTASAPPSKMTLLGLVRHMAEVERNWFAEFVGTDQTWIYCTEDNLDGDWDDIADADAAADLGTLRREIKTYRRELPRVALDAVKIGRHKGRRFSLRWVLVHMIEEYARHNGHADLVRERIDGATGD